MKSRSNSSLFCTIKLPFLTIKYYKKLSIDGKHASGIHIIRYKALSWFYFTFWQQTKFCKSFYDAYFQNFKLIKLFVWTYKQNRGEYLRNNLGDLNEASLPILHLHPSLFKFHDSYESKDLKQFFTKAIGFPNLNCQSNTPHPKVLDSNSRGFPLPLITPPTQKPTCPNAHTTCLQNLTDLTRNNYPKEDAC